MMTMNDIVKRLRDTADDIEKLRREWQAEMISDQFKIGKRDEEIERLRAGNERLRAALLKIIGLGERHSTEIARAALVNKS